MLHIFYPTAAGPLEDPRGTVDEIAALGLRHVGYATPVELFEHFVEGTKSAAEGGVMVFKCFF